MHEVSIIRNIIEIAETQLREHRRNKVKKIYLKIGEFTCISCESLNFIFELMTPGTPVEHATLNIEKIPTVCRCKKCNHRFSVTDYKFNCPQCNAYNITIEQGRELIIDRLEVE